MWDSIQKIFNFLKMLPNFTDLISNITKTGKVDPLATLDCIANTSQGTKKCSDALIGSINRGEGFSGGVNALLNVGEVEVNGESIDTKTIIPKLKEVGGFCGALGNMIESFQLNPQEAVDFGNAAQDVNNWSDLAGKL